MGQAILFLLHAAISLVIWAVIISAILSWLIAFNVLNVRNPNVYRFTTMLDQVTAPILAPIRRVIPPLGGLDLSPIVLILLLQALTILIDASLAGPLVAALG
ncbi:YggT family protein [Sphingomonas sp.]|uniref:YggT family protein n=1 Tax=Sphingomonas sp. TaxID=28214 RepID=UPI003CC50836